MSRVQAEPPLSVLYSFPHALGAPGIGWSAWNQVTELVAAGHRVTLVTAGLVRPVPGLEACVLTLRIGRFRVPHRLVGRDRAFRHHDRCAASRVAAGGFDIVHAWPLAAERTLIAARRSGAVGFREAPNTHTANAYEVASRITAALGLPQERHAAHTFDADHLRTEEREWAAADAVLVPSEPVRRSFLDRGFAGWRLLQHRYGHRTKVSDDAARSRPAPFTALFLGRGEPRKGLHLALAAWQRSEASKTGRLVIQGRIEAAYRDRLAADLHATGVIDAGFTEDPTAALRAADVLLLPSLEEGSALVTYEAQAQGCVPLVSDATGAVLDDGVHGLVHEAGDVETLSAHIDRMAADSEELGRLRAAAVAHGPDLTWTSANSALVAAYRAAARRARRRPTHGDAAVVICSRDRPEMLESALRSVQAATARDVDVVVVDSGSRTDATRAVADRLGVRYVRSDVPGLSIARNVGWRATNRAIVVYTDDDCRPVAGWIDTLVEPFDDSTVGAVTGRMLAQEHRDAPPPYHRRERYERVADGLDAGHGALMAFRRDTLDRLDGFDDMLGAGRLLAGAEDIDMFCRVIADGGVVVHRPSSIVVHENTRVDAAYVSLLAGYGRGLGGLLGKWLRLDTAQGAKLGVRILRRSMKRSLAGLSDPLTLRAEAANLSGVLHGLRATWRVPLDVRRLHDETPPPPVTAATGELAT